MNPVELKRQILEQSEKSGIRKKILAPDVGLNNEEVIEMGVALEGMTKGKGWGYVEAYILNHSNPVARLFEEYNAEKIAAAKALMLLMQYVDQVIKAKNELLEKANEKKENA